MINKNCTCGTERVAQDELQFHIDKHTIAPIRVDAGGRELPGGLLLRPTDLCVVNDFYRHWRIETGSDALCDLAKSKDSDFYLICHPMLKTDDLELAVGALEVSSTTESPRLEWIWVHPNFRNRTRGGNRIAAPALQAVMDLYSDITVNTGGSEIAKSNFERLWERAFPALRR